VRRVCDRCLNILCGLFVMHYNLRAGVSGDGARARRLPSYCRWRCCRGVDVGAASLPVCVLVRVFIPHTSCVHRRTTKEVILHPVTISRNEFESVMVEPSINSVRVSIKIKQKDELEVILAHKFSMFLMQRAEQFLIMRRKAMPVRRPRRVCGIPRRVVARPCVCDCAGHLSWSCGTVVVVRRATAFPSSSRTRTWRRCTSRS
jgi:hypothetical protein